jgi:hypothetical protein
MKHSSNYTVKALEVYKDIYGNVDVPKEYVVPSSPAFPKECWGIKLGVRVMNIKYRGDGDVETRKRYEEIGLPLDYIGFDLRHWEYIYR